EQDAPRIAAVDDQVSDAMGERAGLAGSRAGDDQQRARIFIRADAALDRAPLIGIELVEIGGHRRGESVRDCRAIDHGFSFASNYGRVRAIQPSPTSAASASGSPKIQRSCARAFARSTSCTKRSPRVISEKLCW